MFEVTVSYTENYVKCNELQALLAQLNDHGLRDQPMYFGALWDDGGK